VHDVTTTKTAPSRRFWAVVAAIEVAIASIAVVADVVVPTLVILLIATVSLVVRHDHIATLGFRRPQHPARMAAQVFGVVAAWSVLQLAVIMPVVNHATGRRQDLSDFEDLRHNVALLALLLALTWTIAAFGEEIAYRGFLPRRIRDVVGDGRAGIVSAVLVSSVLFGLAHTEQGLVGVVVTFLDALLFSALKLHYDDNLWASVLAHGFSNTIGLVAFFLVGPTHGFW
jgi:hypothetical protein